MKRSGSTEAAAEEDAVLYVTIDPDAISPHKPLPPPAAVFLTRSAHMSGFPAEAVR